MICLLLFLQEFKAVDVSMFILSAHKGEVGWAGREGWDSEKLHTHTEAPMTEGEFETGVSHS